MDHDDPEDLAARLITEALTTAFSVDPDAPPTMPLAIASIRQWPAAAIPDSPGQIRAAVATLVIRALWPYDSVDRLTASLTPLYQAGWCNDSIIHVLDRNPDSTWATPWNTGPGRAFTGDMGSIHSHDVVDFIRHRLDRWRDRDALGLPIPDSIPANPITHGITFTEWVRRLRHAEQLRLDEAAQRAAERAGQSRRRVGTPVDQARQRAARRAEALGELDPTRAPAPAPRPGHQPRTRPHGDPAAQTLPPGDELALLTDPHVHRALQQFAAAQPRTPNHIHALRTAVANAREAGVIRPPGTYRQVAELAATITDPIGRMVAHKTLRFLLQRAR